MEVTYRAYRSEDQDEVLGLLEDAHLEASSLAYCLRHFPQYGLVAEKDQKIVGCGAHGESDGDGRTICGVFVCQEERRQKIGTALFWRLQNQMRSAGVKTAICDYEKGEAEMGFAESKGLEAMYASRYMSYDGPRLAELKGEFAPYEDADYPEVQKLVSEAFYQMQAAVGMKNPKPEQPSEEQRAEYRSARQNIFVCREHSANTSGGEIVAMVRLDEDEIDTLAVRTDKQGQGWGKSMLSYAVNVLKDRGYEKAYLWVVVGNPAIRMYHNMQWIVESTHIFASKKLS